MKNEKTILWIMITGISCIVITPFLFTHFGSGIDFTSSNTNNIGGTVGGITAPFTGILGSILVYFALKEQVTANKLIQKQLDIIIKDIEKFYHSEKTTKTISGVKTDNERIRSGSDAIYKYLTIYVVLNTHHNDSNYEEDIYQLKQLENLICFIDDFVKLTLTENISEKDKTLLLTALKYSYTTNIKLHFDYLEQHKSSNLGKCNKCEKYHFGIPDKLYEIIYSINKGLQLQ
jgi:hypothetical protein